MGEVLTAEGMWRIPRVGAPSCGGGRIVVPVSTLEDGRLSARIWEVFLDGTEPRRLTSAHGSKPQVDPEGKTVAFLRTVDERPQIHVIPLDGGEARQVGTLPLGVISATWMPDGRRLLAVAPVYREHPSLDATEAERDRLADDDVKAHVTDFAVYRYWDRWLTSGEVPHLFIVDVETGSAEDVTPDSTRWMRWDNTGDPMDDIDVSQDGGTIAWCADRSEWPHGELRFALFLTDVASKTTTCVTPDHEGHTSSPRFSPTGDTLVYGKTFDPHFYADRIHLFELDLAKGSEIDLAPDWDRSPVTWAFTAAGLVLEAEDDATQPLWLLESGSAPRLLARDGTLSSTAVFDESTVVALRSSIGKPPELVAVSIDGTLRTVTSFTADALAGIDLPEVETIRFAGAGGDEVQMYVVTPPGVEGSAPLVHMIHGGPHGTWGDVWHWRWHPAVFCGDSRRAALVNFHGSTSFGQDFAASIRGEWGDLSSGDIEAATDHLVATGVADPTRMAIAGGSYGGYMVAWLIGQTSRYACAVAHAAVTDLPNMMASDITSGRADSWGAEVWTDLDRVNKWSPLANAAGIETPTLVIHGALDYRVPVGQGLELYGLLKAKGVEARLVHYPDENHWILRPANSLHWYREVVAWLDRYLSR